jgi:hypothetical protein
MENTNLQLDTRGETFDRVYQLALETLRRNIRPWRDGLLREEAPAILAGAGYPEPWTRDAAFNTWFAGALLTPNAARNTLLSTLIDDGGTIRIGGQYWDAIAWTCGAWVYWCVTGDDGFLDLAYRATVNSLDYFERTEFDARTGLFEGPASYGDGVSAYPPPYCKAGGSPQIYDYPSANAGVGKNHMKALSTNCLYAHGYRIAAWMTERLGCGADAAGMFAAKADRLRDAINARLWMPDVGRYAYFMDDDGSLDDHMEGLGHAFVTLLDIAPEDRARQVLANQYIAEWGIPCTWPLFERFVSEDRRQFGRHNGTVWPHIQGFWAIAAAERRHMAVFEKELVCLAEMANRHHEFKEIYHPVTGEPYGGVQIDGASMREWVSEPHQTWSATAYIAMIHQGLFGMKFEPPGIRFEPLLPGRFERVRLGPIRYRAAELDVTVTGPGATIERFAIDGRTQDDARLSATLTGRHTVEITMA